MEPVICFYKNHSYIYSTNYLRLDEVSIDFLDYIQTRYPLQKKIIQINFDSTTMTAYILLDFQILTEKDLNPTSPEMNFSFSPDISKDEFIQKVKAIRQDISEGRYYQVNFTSNFSAQVSTDTKSIDLFKNYFRLFKAPYAAYLPRSNSDILCFSPELFLEKNGTSIKTCPIKGTSQKFENIINNEKENAELSMIVDLLRNDLQSICDQPVMVDQHRSEMNLNYISHTYSQVSGITSKNIVDILPRMLPAGSISGCPKKESLSAIKELETRSRDFYTGCIGWWENSDFTLNLAIRSFLRKDQFLTYYSGCGIVYDSDPEKEWTEFNQKACLVHRG